MADDNNSNEPKVVSYKLSQEQKDAIKELFDSKNWDYKEMNVDTENQYDPETNEPGFVIQQTRRFHKFGIYGFDFYCFHDNTPEDVFIE